MEDALKFLNGIDAELLKTELIAFLQAEDMDEWAFAFVDYIEEDFSRGDCEE